MATAASLIKVSWLKAATAIIVLVVFFLLGAAWQGHTNSHNVHRRLHPGGPGRLHGPPGHAMHLGPGTFRSRHAKAERGKQAAVEAALAHAWAGYKQFAWGQDVLAPLSKGGRKADYAAFAGLPATMIDALSTLALFGMDGEVQEAADWLAEQPAIEIGTRCNLFEANIRVLGGLISAYDLTAHQIFLDKAVEFGDLMIKHFPQDRKTGMPANWVSLGDPSVEGNGFGSVAEWGSFGVELYRLSQLTGTSSYFAAAERIYRYVAAISPHMGVLPTTMHLDTGDWTSVRRSVGAQGDSYYEYLLKIWLQKHPQDDLYWEGWERSMDDVAANYTEKGRCGATYIGSRSNAFLEPSMEHLTCFLPGNLALGAAYGPLTPSKAEAYMELAEELAMTCFQMYSTTQTGLGGERTSCATNEFMTPSPGNLLRPEAVESFFYLWRVTGKQLYRDWNWQIFQAFENHSRTDVAHAAIQSVHEVPVTHSDYMESFWLAETLKYIWLSFAKEDVLPLNQWVFNTEAHPLRIVQQQWPQPGLKRPVKADKYK